MDAAMLLSNKCGYSITRIHGLVHHRRENRGNDGVLIGVATGKVEKTIVLNINLRLSHDGLVRRPPRFER